MGHINTLIATVSPWKVCMSSFSEIAETRSPSSLPALFSSVYTWGLDVVPCLGVLDFKSNFLSFIRLYQYQTPLTFHPIDWDRKVDRCTMAPLMGVSVFLWNPTQIGSRKREWRGNCCKMQLNYALFPWTNDLRETLKYNVWMFHPVALLRFGKLAVFLSSGKVPFISQVTCATWEAGPSVSHRHGCGVS